MKHSAARPDRRQQPPRRVADEEEKRVRRRLFEHLEERFDASLLSSSMLSITATRHGDSAAVIPMNSPSSRTCFTVMSRASPRLSPWQTLQPTHVGMAPSLDQLHDRMIVRRLQARQLDWRSRAVGKHAPRSRSAKVALPTPAVLRAAKRGGACGPPSGGERSNCLVLADRHGRRSAMR